ncbi:MAG: T9SS type A sorting domain-containing protein, partial [Bacteroidota bacterium]
VIWDISPASIGNMPAEDLPRNIEDFRSFYKDEGGDISQGHAINPYTGEAYEPQYVPRGDYARVLAEFWADGPDSETPPGHWFSILNYVNDHPVFEKRFKGEGKILDDLEWDVKSYLMLGGAMHDCAISAWGVKGWYDYPRPVSTIRWMGDQGQSTIDTIPSYNINGLELEEGYVELVQEGDSLAGENNEHLGKVKLYTWKGPEFIESPDTSVAGVGWILAENWWPYQRPTFVTPPFAGYVSGHSTYSRAAAELLTLLTGDEFFPGGMGTFEVKKNEFLVFEDGPSQDFELQWATYRDASDQTSLSRIWGGIHPPVDDIPGRLMGIEIGVDAFDYAETFFNLDSLIIDIDPVPDTVRSAATTLMSIAPNPVSTSQFIKVNIHEELGENLVLSLFDLNGRLLREEQISDARFLKWKIEQHSGVYLLHLTGDIKKVVKKIVITE